ncbi:MAG: lactate utilization protein [Oscillospiraceae bacterium]|jgi:L-lactate utilization protein LutB|nr:lactate utilization protein [Oscillospiraceae bacterium]
MRRDNESFSKRCDLLAPHVVKALQSRNFEAYYCRTGEEAATLALGLIPGGASVSWGGSVTLQEIGLLDQVRHGPFRPLDRDTAQTPEERLALMRQALLCDVYLASVNALSEDGQLVNVDGVGNRVAAFTFGPRSVVAVVGMNKLCKTLPAAEIRARTYAAPLNAQRVLAGAGPETVKTPCQHTGTCADCKSSASICSFLITIRMCRPARRIKIILVGEPLGY